MLAPYRGYQIALIAFLSTGLSIGMSQYAFGQFATPLQAEFGWTKTQLNGALSLAFISGITGPILGKSADKYGIKVVLLVSLLMISLGFLLRPTISSLWHWYLYSALVYAGFPGATQITSGKIVPLWFPETRGRVMGAVTSGNNFGGFTMPALAASVISFSGWESAYLIFGSIMLFLAIISYFIISESMADIENESRRTNRNLDSLNLVKKQAAIGFSIYEALKSFRFWTISVALMIGVLTYQGILTQLTQYLEDEGMSQNIATSCLMMIAIMGVIGKITFGRASETFTARKTLILSIFFQAIGTLVLCVSGSSLILWIGCFVYSLGFGAFGALISLTVVEQFGMKNIGSMMGFNAFLTSITMALGPLVAGIIHDQTGSYRNAFLGIAILFFVSMFLVWVSKFGEEP
ncbi:MAG: MFS transporter [Chloroflexota bacterium]|nr:MFS transporter [Chloroflexota bacterium]